MENEARRLIENLELLPHPEGGYYREIHRDRCHGHFAGLGERSAATAIYYLLPAGTFSAFHRIVQDEVWHHYAGGPLRLHLLDPDTGAYRCDLLGGDLAAGANPVRVVPGGCWQAAEPLTGWSLVGCTVAPAFEFVDFTLARRADLRGRFPAQGELIDRLCSP